MASNPRETLHRLQQSLHRQRTRNPFGGGGGNPRAAGGGLGALVLLGLGGWVLSNSLFNGILDDPASR